MTTPCAVPALSRRRCKTLPPPTAKGKKGQQAAQQEQQQSQAYSAVPPPSPASVRRQQQLEHLRATRAAHDQQREDRCLEQQPQQRAPKVLSAAQQARLKHNQGVKASSNVRVVCLCVCGSPCGSCPHTLTAPAGRQAGGLRACCVCMQCDSSTFCGAPLSPVAAIHLVHTPSLLHATTFRPPRGCAPPTWPPTWSS